VHVQNLTWTRFRDLARILISRTEAGTLSWATTDIQTSYALVTPSGSVLMDSIDNDGAAPYAMAITNPDGLVIDRVRSAPDEESWGELDDLICHLYELARRSALNIDDVYRGILGDLGVPDEPPF
jgi:hypothetical protein